LRVSFRRRACFTSLLLASAGVILYKTFGLGRVARMVPLAVVVPTLLLLALQLMMDLLPGLAQTYGRLENKDLFGVQGLREKTGEPGEAAKDRPPQSHKEGKALLWLLTMPALIYLLGLLIALPLYTLLYLKSGSEKWLTAIVIAAVIFGLIYGISTLNAGVRLYEGLLWEWLSLPG
jgi:hypothetical protein